MKKLFCAIFGHRLLYKWSGFDWEAHTYTRKSWCSRCHQDVVYVLDAA